MSDFYPYSNGKFITSGVRHEVVNPYDQTIVGSTLLVSADDLDKSIESATQSKKAMASLSTWERADILHFIAQELRSQKEDFAILITLESGKPLTSSRTEVDRAIETFVVASEETKRIPNEYISIDWTPAGSGKEGLVKYFPCGLVAGIAPFNFPLNLAVHKIAPAIAAGCPIILKPASSTPLSVLKLAQIIHKSNLPKGAFSALPMDRETGNLLVSDERVSLVSFTGSAVVGWGLKQQSGKKKVVLELGGNAGVILTPTTNLSLAITKCIKGGFSFSGQVCIHTQRIVVHQSIYQQFVSGFVNGVKALKAGNPLDTETEMSVLINEENALRIESWVQEALDAGATLLCGGTHKGSFFEPTVLTGTTPTLKVCNEEIFGPVVTVESYDCFSEAVELINQGPYGLQAGVFTDSILEMNEAFTKLEVGGVIINDVPTFRVDHMPYGGVKNSGFGREGVKYAIHHMMEPRVLVKNS